MIQLVALVGPASIPSPSFNTIPFWPRPLTLYGLMIGLGIVAATMLARPRLEARRIHPDTAVEMLMWLVPAGIVGARLYHVATDGKPISEWIEIWNGGLGIPGAIAGGALGAFAFARVRDMPRPRLFDAIVPSLPLAQAFGRIGNYWNQELYGRPTDLPWALEIDADHRFVDYAAIETYHPTFLYELLWNVALCGALLWLDRRRVLRPGKLVWVYTAGYAIGRLWIELLRIDPATDIAGIRVNVWLMSLVLLFSAFMLRNAVQGRGPDSSVDDLVDGARDGNGTDGDGADGDGASGDDDGAGDDAGPVAVESDSTSDQA